MAARFAAASDHVAWCKAQRVHARSLIELLTIHGARLQMHEFSGALRDITVKTVEQNRRLVEHLDAFLGLSDGVSSDVPTAAAPKIRDWIDSDGGGSLN